jgi:hypothetical protein
MRFVRAPLRLVPEMTAQLLPFPRKRCRPPCWNPPIGEPCLILVLPVVRIERECPKIREMRRNTRRLCKHFNWQSSGRKL